ncbi:MAG TPA: hypothetical protein VM847_09955 [Tahibacter sp.]|nr:hypothetical protein [Tahibacter sp.]
MNIEQLPPRRSRQVVYFQFCVSERGGIGPAALQELWKTASRSQHVKVSRTSRADACGFIYSLAAPSRLENLAMVEADLLLLLADNVLGEVSCLTKIAGYS